MVIQNTWKSCYLVPVAFESRRPLAPHTGWELFGVNVHRCRVFRANHTSQDRIWCAFLYVASPDHCGCTFNRFRPWNHFYLFASDNWSHQIWLVPAQLCLHKDVRIYVCSSDRLVFWWWFSSDAAEMITTMIWSLQKRTSGIDRVFVIVCLGSLIPIDCPSFCFRFCKRDHGFMTCNW